MREAVKINTADFGTLAICAIRYCQGRQTYMPSLVQEIVKSHIDKVDDRDLHVMIEDCGFQERCNLYGDEMIDKPGWIKWKEFLLEEKKKRTGDAND